MCNTPTVESGGRKPVWDVVVRQKPGNGVFDIQDPFIVDRKTLLRKRCCAVRAEGGITGGGLAYLDSSKAYSHDDVM